jgi:hypothetical protein
MMPRPSTCRRSSMRSSPARTTPARTCPAGGPARFAQTLVPVIRAAGGEVRVGAAVSRIVTADGAARGVEVEACGSRGVEACAHVISAMGVANTVARLDAGVAAAWQDTVHALRPGLSHVWLCLGFDGAIAAAGATSASLWTCESDDGARLWIDLADSGAAGLFVSAPRPRIRGCRCVPRPRSTRCVRQRGVRAVARLAGRCAPARGAPGRRVMGRGEAAHAIPPALPGARADVLLR